jgi:riboflavin biosynthesis pyrimidine reductase
VRITTPRSGHAALDWLRDRGAEVIVHQGLRVDLGAMLADLADAGVSRLLVEGGGTIVASLLDARLVDEIQPWPALRERRPTPVSGPGLTRQAIR